MTQLIGYFKNLAPGTTYQIRCGLNITGFEIFSDWQNAETDCNGKCDLRDVYLDCKNKIKCNIKVNIFVLFI